MADAREKMMFAWESQPIADAELSALIAGLRREYLVHAEDQAQIIRAAIKGLTHPPRSRDLLEPLIRAAHVLEGGAATFGLAHVGEAAAGLERLARPDAGDVDGPALASSN